MKKLLLFMLLLMPCMADAQEAMVDRTFLEPLEIPGYGTIEGKVTKGVSHTVTYKDGVPMEIITHSSVWISPSRTRQAERRGN